ncbi:lipocalin/cytosolic fatty acid-binding protein Karl isoform X2 [Lasioglossum baleicum]|uniref:lipocalin/cytosolic fatty acid-binding protein Karl isoform X2 n=1 Tax=Lasioglossum baleicum TaxID=434251 RepID=UPI003FCE265D
MRPGTRCSRLCPLIIVLLLVASIIGDTAGTWNRREDKTKCPKVKAIRNFDISEFLGSCFTDDPINEQLVGNITWKVPSPDLPAHWVHAEYPYEGVYNTYVLDSDYKSWALLMHCAEQSKTPRYLSSLIMSRQSSLETNVISYLREKLPRYDIDLEYMFPMDQQLCNKTSTSEMDLLIPPSLMSRKHYSERKHPLRKKHRRL